MTQSVTLTIDGRSVETEKGRLLIDVAEELGIFVPRFCYHPGMKSVAVCRMCLVKVEGAPKLLPACATPVDDGMTVDTRDEVAVDAQQGMLEFLLINHPLDCPICDRAGECPLQDQTYRHGPGSTRYVEPKRHFEKALAISDLVVLDRERCVLCWRCVRFADEVAGDKFIQLVDRGPGTQILTFSDEPFDSYFSGNTIQICPVGALTSKPYRFVARPWDLESAPTVCTYCSVGCPMTNESRAGKLVRCQALPNENVNDFWTCDKGRFGYHHVDSKERLTTPLIRAGGDFAPATWSQALDAVADKVKGARVGVIAGGHLTTEDGFAIGRLARKVLKTRDLDSRVQDAGAPYEMAMELSGIAGSTACLNDLDRARTIVWIGPDPKETLPVLYLRLRGAVFNHHAKLVVVSPRRISLDAFATHAVRVAPGEEGRALAELAHDPDAGTDLGHPIVVCWGPSSPGRDESGAFAAAIGLARARGGKLLICPPHAGSQGMVDMGVLPALDAGYGRADEAGRDTRAILEAAAAGELDALLLFSADPVADFPDASLAERALSSGVFVVAVELFPTETVGRADVVLPSVAYAEREGTFTNLERRLQKLEALLAPPGTAREPWAICAELARTLGDDWGWRDFDAVWASLRDEVATHAGVHVEALGREPDDPALLLSTGFGPGMDRAGHATAGPGARYPKGYRQGAPFHTGQSWPLSWELRAFEAKERPGIIPVPASSDGTGDGAPKHEPAHRRTAPEDGTFTLLSGRLLYDAGAMVSKSAALRGLARGPFVELSEDDAKAIGLSEGDEAVVAGAGHEARVEVRVADIVEGCVFVPYDQPGLRANTLMDGVDPRVTVTRP